MQPPLASTLKKPSISKGCSFYTVDTLQSYKISQWAKGSLLQNAIKPSLPCVFNWMGKCSEATPAVAIAVFVTKWGGWQGQRSVDCYGYSWCHHLLHSHNSPVGKTQHGPVKRTQPGFNRQDWAPRAKLPWKHGHPHHWKTTETIAGRQAVWANISSAGE